MADEAALVKWLARHASSLIGDDTAPLPAGRYAATVDSQVEGIHFQPGTDPAVVARRLLAVNLSDLAAAGVRPRFALLALIAPPGFPHRRFLAALIAAARVHDVALVGGDVARGTQLSASLTLLGERPVEPRGRAGARPGDRLWVGGTLGESAAGAELVRRGARLETRRVLLPGHLLLPPTLADAARRAIRRHLLPTPQLALGAWLASQPRVACLDVSDGLACDLHRLCRASGVGAAVERSAIPKARRAVALAAALGLDAGALALGGGEDYVLLFSLPPDREPPAELDCRAIGVFTTRRAIRLVDEGGHSEPLPPHGWDHLRPSTGG